MKLRSIVFMILAINGSTNKPSSNDRLLSAIIKQFPNYEIEKGPDIGHLPLFNAAMDIGPYPEFVREWKKAVAEASAVIISTPAYLYNMPAALKNALEWLKSSGELFGKPILAVTFTPHPPRGEKAMQSLLWTLQALDARIVAQLPLYQNELSFDRIGSIREIENIELLREAIKLL